MSWWTNVPFPQRSLLLLWVGLPCGSYTNFYLCGIEEPNSILVLSALMDLRRQLSLPRTHAHAETAWAGRSGSLSVFTCKRRCFGAMSQWIKQNTHHHCFLTLRSKWAWSSFPSVQFSSLSRFRLFVTPWIAERQASLSITNSRVHSNSCPSSRWCHPAISSSVVPFCSCS